jgi:hypothetical protein
MICATCGGGVPASGRPRLSDDVQGREAGPHVDESNGLVFRQPAGKLEDVLDGKGIDVDDLRLEFGFARELGVVLDLVALGGHQQEVHLSRFRAPAQHLVVDVHVFDIERDVLLRFPLNVLGQLGRRHHRYRDFGPDDHRLARYAHGHVAVLDFLIVKDAREAFDDHPAVHHVAVDNGLRRKRGKAETYELEPFAPLAQLADLDRARADIDPDEVLSFRHVPKVSHPSAARVKKPPERRRSPVASSAPSTYASDSPSRGWRGQH